MAALVFVKSLVVLMAAATVLWTSADLKASSRPVTRPTR